MSERGSWQGAIVRHRDGRKGLVLLDAPRRWNDRTLLVHWDNDEVKRAASSQVTMLKPPLGYRDVVLPTREPSRFAQRFGPAIAFWPAVASILAIIVIVVLALTEGAW